MTHPKSAGSKDQARPYVGQRIELAHQARPLVFAGGEAGEAGAPAEVQVFVEGDWLGYPREGGLTLTRRHFDEMVRNKVELGDDPPVDREHECTAFDDRSEARGWVKGLRVGTDDRDPTRAALFATVEWTDLGESEVRKRYYRYVSGGVYLEARRRTDLSPIGAVLDHVSICKRPFIQGMRPLTNSRLKEDEMDPKDFPARIEQLAGGAVDEAALKVLKLSASASLTELSKAIGELHERATRAERELAELHAAEMVREVDAAVAELRATPAERDGLLELGQKDRPLLQRILAARSPAAPGGPPLKLPQRPRGSESDAQIEAVEAYMKSHPELDFHAALLACSREKPELLNNPKEVPHARP